MAESNVERLRAVYTQWAQGNFAAGGEIFAPDVSFEPMSDMTFYALWTFRGGLAIRARWETDRAKAFEAAGLRD